MYCKNMLQNECSEKGKKNKKRVASATKPLKITQIRRLEGLIRMSPPSLNLLGQYTAICYCSQRLEF
jgi:hypothetical protein